MMRNVWNYRAIVRVALDDDDDGVVGARKPLCQHQQQTQHLAELDDVQTIDVAQFTAHSSTHQLTRLSIIYHHNRRKPQQSYRRADIGSAQYCLAAYEWRALYTRNLCYLNNWRLLWWFSSRRNKRATYLSTSDVAGLQNAFFRGSYWVCRVGRVCSGISGSYRVRVSFWLYVASWYDI